MRDGGRDEPLWDDDAVGGGLRDLEPLCSLGGEVGRSAAPKEWRLPLGEGPSVLAIVDAGMTMGTGTACLPEEALSLASATIRCASVCVLWPCESCPTSSLSGNTGKGPFG